MSKPKKSPNSEEAFIDYDGKWKMIIEELFEQFIKFFLPEIHHLIDFTKPVHFLKQDIEKIVSTNSKENDQIYDNLAEVHLKSGKKSGLLVHIEVHGYEYVDLGQKMLQYCYRGLDKFNFEKELTALAILVADRLPQNYKGYHYKFGKTSIDYAYPVYIIRDQNKADLLQSNNPFALAVLACLKLLDIRAANKKNRKGEYIDRFIAKKELLKLLEQRYLEVNYTEQEIVALLEFVMNIIALPPTLEKQFKDDFYEPYVKQHKNMELSPKGRMYANMVTKAYFGSTYDEVMLQIQNFKENWLEERKQKEEAIRKAEEDRKQKEEAIRKAEEDRKQKEEAIRKAEEDRKQKEEAIRKAEEDRKQKEEAIRKAEEDRKQKEEAIRKAKEDRKQKEEVLEKQEKQILNLYYNVKLSKEQIAQAMELELNFVEAIITKKEAE